MVAIDNDPNSKVAELTMAAWHCAWIEHKPNHAIQLLRQALLLDANYAAAYLEMAKIFFYLIPTRMDLAELAVRLFLKSIPQSADGQNLQGQINIRLGKIEDAAQDFAKARELDPFDERPVVGLAGIYRTMQRLPEAIKLLELAVEMCSVNPSFGLPATRSILAYAYLEVGDVEKALEQFELILEMKGAWPVDDDFGPSILEARSECKNTLRLKSDN